MRTHPNTTPSGPGGFLAILAALALGLILGFTSLTLQTTQRLNVRYLESNINRDFLPNEVAAWHLARLNATGKGLAPLGNENGRLVIDFPSKLDGLPAGAASSYSPGSYSQGTGLNLQRTVEFDRGLARTRGSFQPKLDVADPLCVQNDLVGATRQLCLASTVVDESVVLDTSFNGVGVALDTTLGTRFNDVVYQPSQNRIIVVGSFASSQLVLLAYQTDGTLDNSFDTDGRVRWSFGYTLGKGVDVQPDGKIVVVGQAGGTLSNRNQLVLRFLPDGQLDTTFGSDGSVLVKYSSNINHPNSGEDVAIQSDGKIVIVGQGYGNSGIDHWGGYLALTRLLTDGSFDMGFDTDGRAYSPINRVSAFDITLLDDGRIIGLASGETNQVTLFAFNSDGSHDLNFENGLGYRETPFSSVDAIPSGGVKESSGGRILVGGVDATPIPSVGIAAYTSDGEVDTSFGAGGSTFHAQPDLRVFSRSDLTLDTDGRPVVLAGFLNTGGFAFAHYDIDGNVDPSVDTTGTGFVKFPQPGYQQMTRITILPNGKLVAVGTIGMPCLGFSVHCGWVALLKRKNQ